MNDQNSAKAQQFLNPVSEQYQQGYLRGGAAMSQDCAAERQTAKGALRVRAKQLHREAERLEALAKSLPEELPPMADEALYYLICAGR